MDPDQALSDLIDAVIDSDAVNLIVTACDLAAWIRTGGYQPRDPRLPEQLQSST